MSPVTAPELTISQAIRLGLEHPDYKLQVRSVFTDGCGGYCASGIAMLGYGLTKDEILEIQTRLDADINGDLTTHGVTIEPLAARIPDAKKLDTMDGLFAGIGEWIINRNDALGLTPTEIAEKLEAAGL